MIDVWLKIAGPPAQAVSAISTLGLDAEMLPGGQLEDSFTHDIAMLFIPNLITKFATHFPDGTQKTPPIFSGPHLMIRFLSDEVEVKVRAKIIDHSVIPPVSRPLPPGLQHATAPVTLVWA